MSVLIDVIKSALGGLARFVLAGVIPSALALAGFGVVYAASYNRWDAISDGFSASTLLAATAAFALLTVTSAVLFAYLQLPIYRFLEGYTLPRRVQRILRKRQLRRWHRLRALAELGLQDPENRLLLERLEYYPEDAGDILPTRLGNALKRMERYGSTRFGLDGQTFWYELQSVATESLRKDTEDGRTQVDFFVSSMVNLVLLGAGSLCIAAVSPSPLGYWVALATWALVPLVYRAAVISVLDYRYAVQALIHTGRLPLSRSLGMEMPVKFEDEQAMWESWVDLVHYPENQAYKECLNHFRSVQSPQGGQSAAGGLPPGSNRT